MIKFLRVRCSVFTCNYWIGGNGRYQRPYICNDCKWYKSTVIKCCLENAIKMCGCTFTQGMGLNNNETHTIKQPFHSLFCSLHASSFQKILTIYVIYCHRPKVHIVKVWPMTLWMTFVILPLLKPLLSLSSCLKRNNQRSAVISFCLIHKPGLRWQLDINTAAPPAVYFSYVPWTKVYPQPCCYQPRVYWIVLTLTHSV